MAERSDGPTIAAAGARLLSGFMDEQRVRDPLGQLSADFTSY